MSIAGYLARRGSEWSLRNGTEKDDLGIKVEGAVLAGEKSLEERWVEDAARSGNGDGEFYSGLEDYDPVLKGHCR